MNIPTQKKLSNGLTIITDNVLSHHSVSIKLWIRAGSSFETKDNNGIAHFLEHMAFKGTKTRTAHQIAQEFDDLGGYFNACTGREYTIYYVKVLNEFAEKAIEILSDITLNSLFAEDEMKREKSVILEEIAQTEDTPDDIIFDKFFEAIYPEQSFGRSILGTRENVKNFQISDLRNFVDEHYFAENMMLIASGGISHLDIKTYSEKYLSKLQSCDKKLISEIPQYYCANFRQSKKLEQTHVILGFPSISGHNHMKAVYTAKILSIILGGSMSSKLFQEVREKRGLAYNISSFNSINENSGVFGIYSSTDPKNLSELIKITFNEINQLKNSITEDEIKRAKQQIKSSVLMKMEANEQRCSYIGHCMQYYDRYIEDEELIKVVDLINLDDIKSVVDEIFSEKKLSIAVLGEHKDLPEYNELIKTLNG
jgi:predicted Zn-dependent peptidase